jgi:Flp pilus assembly protein TadB
MKRLFSPNISKTGRRVRGGIAVLLFLGAGFAFAFCIWLGLALLLSGVFVLFEALRGWCALRACGIKTRL